MKDITSNTDANGIGDVDGVANIIDTIMEEEGTVTEPITQNIIESVSFLMDSDLSTDLVTESIAIKNR